jgi:histidyl-tRNA synthetase
MGVENTAALPPDPLVVVTFTPGEGTRHAAIQAAAELRAGGVRAELAEGKLKKVFEIANKLDARLAIISGENEAAAGELSMKDMRSQQQTHFPRELLLERVRECLK